MTGARQPAAVAQRSLKLGILYNAHSGRHRKRWAQPDLGDSVPAIRAKTAEEIRAGLTELAREGVELLAIAGGDGTVQSVLSHVMLGDLFERPPLLALVPTGSTNMTGNDVGTVRVKREGWQKLQAWADNPVDIEQRVVARDVLKIDPGGDAPAFCGMFFGAGAIYNAVEHTQRNLHQYGLRGDVGPGVAFTRFVKAVATGDRRYFSPVTVRLRDDLGNDLDEASILLFASTLDTLVLRLHPFWGEEPGPVAWTTVAESAEKFLRRMPAVCRGRRRRWMTPEKGYRSHNTQRLELLFDGGYIVDGEFFSARVADGPVVLSSAGKASFLNL
ncbi:diacylglycerol kinase catalytic subunit [Salinisphaera shabanensis T35B1]|uniref:Transcriptional regulator protein n=1 Tax=Salinisphaera shabanensis E1L3A TaxID=1033802 RepID=U2FXN4_9GAMM|nr:Transcriptional regulator protein [Salinisphaera shabanensis E1L3A]